MDKCHQQKFYKKMFGICNNENDALNACLKQLTLETKRKALEEKRSKNEIIREKWREIDLEENPEDDILFQEIIRREREKKNVDK